MTKQELYNSKFVSMQEALNKVHSGDVIVVGFYADEPRQFLNELHTIGNHVENVTVWSNNPYMEYPFIANADLAGKIDILTVFYGPSMRKNHDNGRIQYAPHNLHQVSQAIIETKRPNVFVAAVSPMDADGYVRMACSQQIEPEMFEIADKVICEVNPRLPFTCNTLKIPVEKVDCFVAVDYELSTPPEKTITEVDRAVAKNIATLIKDGDTIQFGIGALPDAMVEALSDRNDLGIYTEMLGTSMGKLLKRGIATNKRKNLFPGETVCVFAWGSNELYDFMDHNEKIRLFPASFINDPFNVAKNDNMVSVNMALQVDLTGQVCSESLGFRHYSGTGGAMDFAYGAFHSKGGKGIIALKSTAVNGTISRIQTGLTYGAAVTVPRNIVDYVVTEYGIAHLRGATLRDRVERMINIAHPDFRGQLREEVKKLMI